MTICTDADLGRRAKAHLATITATGNLILFHASHRKLVMSGRRRVYLYGGGLRKRAELSATFGNSTTLRRAP